jgi:dipeptidyl aminopeptidase/acylaminoacyl peptidase
VVSRRGDRLACPLSVGEHDEVRLYDARTLRPAAAVELPPGTGGPTGFSPDGARLFVDWSTPEAPEDIYAVDVKTGAATPLRRDERPGLAALPPLDVSVAELAAHDGLRLRANLYLPPAAKEGQKLPVIVAYHGGPAGVSTLRWSPFIRFMTAQGYAYVEPNIRGSGGFGRAFEMADDREKRLDAFKDVETSGRWVAAQPWADPGRLVIWGQSYGGFLVLVGLTRMPDLWRAGVDLLGMSDLASFLQSTSGFNREVLRAELGDLEADRDFLDEISPLRAVGKIADPLFVYAGANDPRVPRTESDQLVRALRERRVAVEYMVAPNEGHSLSRRENLVMFMARVARFLEVALK